MPGDGKTLTVLPSDRCAPFLTPCSDTRLGVQGLTVSCDFEKVFKIHDSLFIGLAGLATDVQTV